MTTIYLDPVKQEVIKACIKENKPALLIGETGTGKTTIIREEALLMKKKLVRIPVNGSTSIEEIIGKWLAKDGTTYWQDGILTRALKNGDWVTLDEINMALPEILAALQPLLDDDRYIVLSEKDGEIVHPHADFRFFATMNPSEEYAGTKEMNKALISRFTAVIHINVPGADIEMKILIDKGAKPKDAQDLVQLAQKLRDKKKEEQIYYFCSTRDLIHAVDLVKGGMKLKDATMFAVFGKMSLQEFEAVKSLAGFSFVVKKLVTIEDMAEATALAEIQTEKIAELEGNLRDMGKLISAPTLATPTSTIKTSEDVKKLLAEILRKK